MEGRRLIAAGRLQIRFWWMLCQSWGVWAIEFCAFGGCDAGQCAVKPACRLRRRGFHRSLVRAEVYSAMFNRCRWIWWSSPRLESSRCSQVCKGDCCAFEETWPIVRALWTFWKDSFGWIWVQSLEFVFSTFQQGTARMPISSLREPAQTVGSGWWNDTQSRSTR